MTEQEIRKDIMRHIIAHNIHFTYEYLWDLSLEELLREAHPVYREYYEGLIRKMEDK